MLTTTINQLKQFNACSEGLETLKNSLPPEHQDTDKITLAQILESNGLDHAIWALRTQEKKYSVEFAISCAENVIQYYESKYPSDDRPKKAIEAAKTWLMNPSVENQAVARAASDAVASAASDAVASAASAAVASAASAARAAARAAYAAAAAARAASAAGAAAASARAAAAASAEQELQKELFLKVINTGVLAHG